MQQNLPSETDITEEPYLGPSRKVAAAGEGAIAHYFTGFGGLIIGAVGSFFGYKSVHKFENALENFSARNVSHSNGFVSGVAKAIGYVRYCSNKAGEHLTKAPFLKNVKPERMDAMIFGGGLLGVAGFFLAPVYFAFTGVKHANEGRRQHQRAIDEILTTREERDALREKYAEATVELATLKAQKKAEERVRVSADETPTVAPASSVMADSPTHNSPPPIEPAQTTGRVLSGEPPRVQTPVIGPELADSPTHNSPPPIEPAQTTGRVLSGEPPRIQTPVIGPELADSPTHNSPPPIEPAQTTGRVLSGEPPRVQTPTIGPELAAKKDHASQHEAHASWREHAEDSRAQDIALTH